VAASIAARSEAFVVALPADHSGVSVVHNPADGEGAEIFASLVTARGEQAVLDVRVSVATQTSDRRPLIYMASTTKS
jgi:hypothetical protein